MPTTSIIGLLCSIVCFASYTWAIVALFNKPDGQPMKMKLVSGMGFIFFLAQLVAIVRGKPLVWLAILGICFYGIAFVLFWWAVTAVRGAGLNVAFTTTQPSKLLIYGPYRYIRHPFYASYLAFWIAGVMVSSEPLLLPCVVCMGLLYTLAMKQEEREFRQGPLREAYHDYALVTGKVLPRVIYKSRQLSVFILTGLFFVRF